MQILNAIILKYVIIDGKSLSRQFYDNAFGNWIINQKVASTVFPLFFAILWTYVAKILSKFNLFLNL
jgi:hypothetical protein